MMGEEFYPGRRLSYSLATCTIRYVGVVKGTKGEWLGVEWDDPSKGRHDGSHAKVKYFDCRNKSPTAGSFVRPSRPYDRPLSFLQALRRKYAPSDGEGFDCAESQILIDGKFVQEIGFGRVRDQLAALNGLRVVLLDGLCVVGVGGRPWDEPPATRMLSLRRIYDQELNIVELDLSRNIIETWAEVADICGALQFLRSLKVNGNRFRDLSFETDLEPFLEVRDLGLDETFLTWDDIVLLTKNFPSLTSLSVASNEITTITTTLATPNLTSLNLSSNLFTTLASLRSLAILPYLATLTLRSNPLVSVSSPAVFPMLTHLDLTSTLLDSFPSLSPLTQICPALTSLLITNTPLSRLQAASLITIARHPTLTSLNFSTVKPAERQNAELYYLSIVARELSEAFSEQDRKRILAEHMRYAELCEVYGEPAMLRRADEKTSVGAGTLEARIVKFTFYSTIEGVMSEKKKDIPCSADTYRVKGIVGRLFGIRPSRCRLVWEMGEWDPVGPEEEGWSCSEEDDDGKGLIVDDEKKKGAWVKREVELLDSTKDVGFWIDSREARVRIELR